MTKEERRSAVVKWVRSRVGDDKMNYKEAEIGIALLEEIWSIADAWADVAAAMDRMAKAQEAQLDLQRSMFLPRRETPGHD